MSYAGLLNDLVSDLPLQYQIKQDKSPFILLLSDTEEGDYWLGPQQNLPL